ncbi:MAG: PEP-CTERM sorting domain-containing protein [Verrucomicrobiota bacterium]
MTGAAYTQTTAGALGVSSGILSFTYDVLANTLDGSAPYGGYTANAFIKVFTPGFSYFFGSSSASLTPGVGIVNFNLGALTDGNPLNVVQYGYELVGPNANPATVASLGLVTIAAAPVPEPSTLALAGMGGMALLTFFRRRSNK